MDALVVRGTDTTTDRGGIVDSMTSKCDAEASLFAVVAAVNE